MAAETAKALLGGGTGFGALPDIQTLAALKEKPKTNSVETHRALAEDDSLRLVMDALQNCGYTDGDAQALFADLRQLGKTSFMNTVPASVLPRGLAAVSRLLDPLGGVGVVSSSGSLAAPESGSPGSKDADAWANLGILGGGTVQGTFVDKKSCYIRALELDPKHAATWNNLGILGGGTVQGTFVDKKSCYIRALELDPKKANAWNNLGVLGGGTVQGTFVDEKSCYIRVLELDPKHAAAWNNLGILGGGTVQGTFVDKKSCYIRALELDPKKANAWNNLGVLGGGTIQGTFVNKKSCYIRTLELDPGKEVAKANLANTESCVLQ